MDFGAAPGARETPVSGAKTGVWASFHSLFTSGKHGVCGQKTGVWAQVRAILREVIYEAGKAGVFRQIAQKAR